ncbi:MAG TPA: hypothetical protein ENJ16_04310, partial [Planctomycetaceae bacterium]|nr:hypothetical protein [Planctomycetaceae bacterium]
GLIQDHPSQDILFGGRDAVPAAFEFDLSRLLGGLESPEAIDRAVLALDALVSVDKWEQPHALQVAGDTVYFAATTPQAGTELWKTDGTAAGTSLVRDIVPGADGSLPLELTSVDDILFFSVLQSGDPNEARALWVSDGTEPGTHRVDDSGTGGIANPQVLMPFAGQLFFVTNDGGARLWATTGEGTNVGLKLISTTGQLSHLTIVRSLVVGNNLYLAGRNAANQWELWRIGAANPVRDIEWVGTFDDIIEDRHDDLLQNAAAVGDVLYFAARDNRGVELWKTDGQSGAGHTERVADLNPGSRSSNPHALAGVGDRLFFLASDSNPTTQVKVWVSDGTKAGTFPVPSTPTMPVTSASTNEGRSISGRYVFTIDGPDTVSLMTTKGDGLTTLLSLPVTGNRIGYLTPVDNQLLFEVVDSQVAASPQLYATDMTVRGTRSLFTSPVPGTALGELTRFGQGTLFVGAVDPDFPSDNEIWLAQLDPLPTGKTVRLLENGEVPGQLLVEALVNAGDGVITGRDFIAEATNLLTESIVTAEETQRIELDVSEFIRERLAVGERNITLRLKARAVGDSDPLRLRITRPTAEEGTGLRVTRRHGVRADLLDQSGGVLEENIAAADLRNLTAGTYYLRVFNPHRAEQTDDLTFSIEVKPPALGQFHPLTDRDVLRGDEGADILVGNRHLDRIFGESGNDVFLAERVEVHDREQEEPVRPPLAAERIVSDPPIVRDPWVQIRDAVVSPDHIAPDHTVEIADVTLGRLLASELEIPLKEIAAGPKFAVPVRVTDLARLFSLDASAAALQDRGLQPPISDLSGLEYASNLDLLNLSGNEIRDLSMIDPGRDIAGAATGLSLLRYLNLDGNPLPELFQIDELQHLRVLSVNDTIESTQPGWQSEFVIAEEGQSFTEVPDFSL